MQPLHCGFTIQKDALLLNAERCQSVVIVDDGHVAVYRCGKDVLIVLHSAEKVLDLIEAAPGNIVRIQNAVAKLFRPFGSTPVAEVEKAVTASGHSLPAPHLGLVGPGQKAGDVVPLSPHNGLGDPEIVLAQATDIIQAKGDLTGRKGGSLAAPHRVVVIGDFVQTGGQGGKVHVLSQSAAGKIMNHHRIGDFPAEDVCLEGSEGLDVPAAKSLPIHPQGRVVGCNGGGGEGNFVKIIVLLAPKGGTPVLIELVDIAMENLPKIGLESGAAPGTPALVTAFMAQLIVHLPGDDGFLVPVMAGQRGDDLFAVSAVDSAAEAINMAAAVGAGRAVRMLGENIRMLLDEPGGGCGSGGAKDHA